MNAALKFGVIGLGTFSQFIIPYLTPFGTVSVWNRTPLPEIAEKLGAHWADIEEVIAQDIIILATNIAHFEIFLKTYGYRFNPHALVLDVASVKIKPVQWMSQYLPSTCQIVATHPLFGPQSGANGIQNLNMVLCPVRTDKLECIKVFLEKNYQLNILIRTPEEHDQEMAYVQALTHYVARAVSMMKLPSTTMDTLAFKYLKKISELLGNDSIDLFKSIELDNPFAKCVRTQFLENLKQLDGLLEKDKL